MAKVIDITRRAFRLVGIISAGEVPTADQVADALSALNALVAEMIAAGIALPITAVASESETISTPADENEAIAYALAQRIAPEYGIPLSAEILASANESMHRLRCKYFTVGEVDFTELPCVRVYFDPLTG